MGKSGKPSILMFLQLYTTLSAFVIPARATGSVEILSHMGYLDSAGNYHVVGEVQNVGTQAVNFIQVTAAFYDSRNRVSARDSQGNSKRGRQG
jgi:hypothetical protein